MINSVRNTVLFLLNKDNRGYIAPLEYNYFAKQAQLEMFEQYFSDYSKAMQLQNARKKAIGHGDTVSQIQNKIDIFTTSSTLNYTDVSSTSVGGVEDYFILPVNLYKLINVTYKSKIVQGVPTSKFDMLSSSNLTAPSITYPIYKRNGSNLFVRPLSIYYTAATPQGTEPPLVCNYVRKPLDPNWGYNTINNDPVYNSDTSTNFEIPSSDESSLVVKICKLAGLSIRENDVVQATNAMEGQTYQKQNT
jgi:hypothetical protein|tara:strand:+ start:2361 stop:3104 length:744 start_codon:yes stop_codon:yes gene_type:complete